MKRIFGLFAVCFASVLSAGCQANAAPPDEPPQAQPPPRVMGCTQIGCADGFTLNFSPAESWPAGAYRFVIDADGEQTVCEGSLPLPACQSGSALRCSGEGVQIGESGCALPAASHAFSGFQLRAAPKQIDVEILRDGVSVAHQSFTPKYATLQPNGPDCAPTCHSATDTLLVR